MTISIVRLGTARGQDEGLRIGTVRRPPRGVPKTAFASGNWYDVWYPNLAPSVETMQLGQQAETPAQWQAFAKKFRSEMNTPDASRTLDPAVTVGTGRRSEEPGAHQLKRLPT